MNEGLFSNMLKIVNKVCIQPVFTKCHKDIQLLLANNIQSANIEVSTNSQPTNSHDNKLRLTQLISSTADRTFRTSHNGYNSRWFLQVTGSHTDRTQETFDAQGS
ncbi:hypothetical protein AVEN_193999-1 [Araneus ventricosus]|uniref:Uncharacterized protein n=1 Tax=Araneus ventricosus TaxID=182803 RepID=A0A4Y2SXP7_ARAVE|nr:hypothetical protein AVEN_193999-1 [Araneus ventricosus]